MKAFDTDILTLITLGDDAVYSRAVAIPVEQQAVPSVVLEEVLRGRFDQIRKSESVKSKLPLHQAYSLFERSYLVTRELLLLPFTPESEAKYDEFRSLKLKIGTHDLRIAAICIAHSATLVARNRRDFERISGLTVEFW